MTFTLPESSQTSNNILQLFLCAGKEIVGKIKLPTWTAEILIAPSTTPGRKPKPCNKPFHQNHLEY